MLWNWQQQDWPSFSWNSSRLIRAEAAFLLHGGKYLGLTKHLPPSDHEQVTVEIMSGEALTTSEIEGELFDRASVQSSIRRQLGLTFDARRTLPGEEGVSEMTVDLYRNFARPLDQATLFAWHRMIVMGRTDLHDVGRYRTHPSPMQVVSGAMYAPRIHFEAPSSSAVPDEMRRFIDWFNESGPDGGKPLPCVTRAAVAHLFFESIHPFEDGNGRVGRAIAEKALAQGLGEPSLTALAATILIRRKEYYHELEMANKSNQISQWVAWFAAVCLEAQQRTLTSVEFVLEKTRMLDRLRDQLNERQSMALLRMFREGPEGFTGGLSAGKYATIAKTSPATATRDLADLVERGALTRTGEKKHTRYLLPIPLRPTPRITIDQQGDIVIMQGQQA